MIVLGSRFQWVSFCARTITRETCKRLQLRDNFHQTVNLSSAKMPPKKKQKTSASGKGREKTGSTVDPQADVAPPRRSARNSHRPDYSTLNSGKKAKKETASGTAPPPKPNHKAHPDPKKKPAKFKSTADPNCPAVKWRQEGNSYYVSGKVAGLAPTLKIDRMQAALRCYMKSYTEATGDPDLMSSAAKNYAKSAWYLAQVTAQSGDNLQKFTFYYEQAIRHFGKAIQCGRRGKDEEWVEDVLASYKECLEDAMRSVSSYPTSTRVGHIEAFAQAMEEDSFKVDCYQEMATILFHDAVVAIEKKDFKTSLYSLKECYRPIEEMKRCGGGREDIAAEVNVLEADVQMSTASAESLKALATGEAMLETVVKDEENLDMDMVYEVIDWFRSAAILSRELVVEIEAIAMSRLGKVYNQVLKLKHRAKEYFTSCLHLAHSLVPRTFTSEDWFRLAADSLNKWQKESLLHQDEERQKERKKYLDELKDELKKLKDSDQETKGMNEKLLKLVYKTFPPKNKRHKLPGEKKLEKMTKNELKKILQKAILHFHPDKQDVEKYGMKWKVLCEEITKVLTNRYEYTKM